MQTSLAVYLYSGTNLYVTSATISVKEGSKVTRKALIDYGAIHNNIDIDFAKKAGLEPFMKKVPRVVPIYNVDGTPNKLGAV